MSNMNFVRVGDYSLFAPFLISLDDLNVYFINNIQGSFHRMLNVTYNGTSYRISHNLPDIIYDLRVDGPPSSISKQCKSDTGFHTFVYYNCLLRSAALCFDINKGDGAALFRAIKESFDFTPLMERNFASRIKHGWTSENYGGMFSEDTVSEVIQLEKDLDIDVVLVSPFRSVLVFKSIQVGGKEDIIADCAVCIYTEGTGEARETRIYKLVDYPNSMKIFKLDSADYVWHPHIANDGGMCLGDARYSFYRAVEHKNLLETVLIFKSFLESWNPGNVVNDAFGKER